MQKSRLILLGSFLAILITGIVIAYNVNLDGRKLPIYNPADLNPQLVDSSLQNIAKNHTILPFKLVNQNGDTITEKLVHGKILVVDFFFATCQSICPKMTSQLLRVQDAFLENEDVIIISHSVTPDIDSVAALRVYAEEKGVNNKKWHLVTGDKPQIYNLARKSYFAVTLGKDFVNPENWGNEDDFIHTENVVLVDADKRLRGFYDGTSTEDVDRLMMDIRTLQRETRNRSRESTEKES